MAKHRNIERAESYVVIIRACWERGESQIEALKELQARGLWLSPDQKAHASQGLTIEQQKEFFA